MSEQQSDGGSAPETPADLHALARHAVRLTSEVEKVWSDALDPTELERAQRGTTAALQALTRAIVEDSENRDERLQSIGVDPTLHAWPPSADSLLEWDEETASAEERWRVMMMSHVRATEMLIDALSPLVEASGAETDLLTGQERRRWWEAGGFALAQSRARLLERLALELDAAEAELRGDSDDLRGMHDRLAFDVVRLATVAYRRGDPEATLLHCVRAAQLCISGVCDAQVLEHWRWERLESVPELRPLGRLLSRARAIIEQQASPNPAAGADALLLATVLLPRLQRFVSAPPVQQLAALCDDGERR